MCSSLVRILMSAGQSGYLASVAMRRAPSSKLWAQDLLVTVQSPTLRESLLWVFSFCSMTQGQSIGPWDVRPPNVLVYYTLCPLWGLELFVFVLVIAIFKFILMQPVHVYFLYSLLEGK